MRVTTLHKSVSFALGLATALSLYGGSAAAQNELTVALPALEEIIVTATRMPRTLDRVPAAMSVVGEEDLQVARQQLTLDEGLSRVPGLFMQNQYNFAQRLRISIRGFGARANFGIRGIKILVDGIPETLPDGQGQVSSIDIGATSQVEVIRGPSSTLYGNASGGVIHLTSQAGPPEPFIEARATGGEFGFRRFQIKTGGQTERMDYFVSLSDATFDGYRDHSANENTQLSGRFRFDLGQDRELAAVFNYTDQPVSGDPGGVTAELANENPRAAWPANVDFDAGEAFTQSRVGFHYSMPLGEGHEISARNYYMWRDFANRLPFLAGGRVEFDRFFAGGGVSYSYDGFWLDRPNRVIVGYDFDRQDDDRRRFDNLMGLTGDLTFDQNETVQSQGLFVQNELRVTPDLELTLGLRYDQVRFDVTDHFLEDGDDSGSRRLDDVSPMVGLVYNLNPNVNLYATYSSAFETPTTTELIHPSGAGGFNPNIEPQIANNYEVGVRGMLNDRQRYELALFRINVKDELIPFEVPGSPGRNFYANAGRSTREGAELSWMVRPTDNLRTTVSYTYSDFRYREFVDAGANDFGGNALPGAPEHLVFAEVSYLHPRGWFGAVDALYVGEQYTDNANSAVNDSYTLANLRFGFERDIGGSMVISPFVGINNVLDQSYNANVRINAFGGRFYEPAPGRNAYGGVTLRYDLGR